ncbi:DOMON domain-containing protein [Methanogenium marinum]|uniref:DOMON domain-containing protein n=1 Tax=Methanogenium marinum TaxID=348610 RepID=A0A9Q4KR42_9EURY|nr:DOMON domain-containing protein [Methanogenium marinum]MDE4907034.1 DOMON domain-containing protein [Methanogenium marinum]
MDAVKLCVILLLAIAIAGCSDEIPDTTIPEPTETPVTTSAPVTTIATSSSTPTFTTTSSSTWNSDGVISEGEYAKTLSLNGGNYVIHWKFADDMIHFGLETTSPGWAAIGFEPTTRMKDADIILGGAMNGVPYLFDMFSTGPIGPHPPDTDLGGTYDITEYNAKEQAEGTIVEFSRKTDTGDSYDKILTPGAEITIIWAQADSDEPLFKHNIGKGSETIIL